MIRSRSSAARVLALSLLLAGGAAGLTACASGTPGAAATSTAAAPASAPPSAASPSAAAPSTSSPSASAPAAPTAEGCAPNDVPVPAGVTTAEIGDVDGDGRADQEFFVEEGGFAYGLRTASGATFLLPDPLAGPGGHSGWTVPVGPGLAATVLDDGRSAALYAFADCAFVTPIGADGEPYRFVLAGFGDAGTGVACTPAGADGDRSITGLLAEQAADGRYSLTSTTIDLSADGRTATNGAVTSVGEDLAQDDPAVVAAMTSSCDGVAIVSTSGM